MINHLDLKVQHLLTNTGHIVSTILLNTDSVL